MGFQGVCDLWIFVIEHASLEGRIVKTLYSQCRVNVEAGVAFRSPMQNAISPNQSTFAMLISNNPPLRYCDTLTHQKQQGFSEKAWFFMQLIYQKLRFLKTRFSAQYNEINARLHPNYASLHKISYQWTPIERSICQRRGFEWFWLLY